MVGSTRKMLQWVKDFPHEYGRIIVATEEGLLHNMRESRPSLDIQQAPTYSGCQCNSCPYMKLNTEGSVVAAIMDYRGEAIKLDKDLMNRARKPIERMLSYE